MQIKYLDGFRFYNAIRAGGEAVIANQEFLNRINIFPVPDSDTGTNMASTMQTLVDGSEVSRSLQKTINSMADSALIGARGNSGIIFAQFICGLSEELKSYNKIFTDTFAKSVRNATKHVYESLMEPVEGTIITVMKDWSVAISNSSHKTTDFVKLLSDALIVAKLSLKNTPKQLKILEEAGVVDAGANGFVNFLEGVSCFIESGKLSNQKDLQTSIVLDTETVLHAYNDKGNRFCTEAIVTNYSKSISDFRNLISEDGNSLLTAGTSSKFHFHIHTNDPAIVYNKIIEFGNISRLKVDDMKMQYQVSHLQKYPIALVTDSACDLPEELLSKYQIQQLPFNINFGSTPFLDKLTITPELFYDKLKSLSVHPVSSQPSINSINSLYSFLSPHYQDIIGIHISENLSGLFYDVKSQTQKDGKVSLFNSKTLTASQGLIVLRTAIAIEAGSTIEQLNAIIPQWIDKTKIFVDVDTLKYMVRGGRVSPIKGLVASALNLKPIVSLDSSGKAIAVGKSFSRKANQNKIVQIIKKVASENKIWNYAIVHAKAENRANSYAKLLTNITGKAPAYIMPLSPVIGVHNGIGAVGIAIMEE